jgi:hypothetical protein
MADREEDGQGPIRIRVRKKFERNDYFQRKAGRRRGAGMSPEGVERYVPAGSGPVGKVRSQARYQAQAKLRSQAR